MYTTHTTFVSYVLHAFCWSFFFGLSEINTYNKVKLMCGNITRLKKLSEYTYEIAIDNIFNFVKYT